MSLHPCSGHPCDHCYLCDVLGICCLTVPTTQPPGVAAASPKVPDVLHDAVVQDATAAPSLSQLVRAEGVRPRLAGLLLPGPSAAPIHDHSGKETVRVLAARTTE